MNDEFENALAWFSAAPGNWIKSAKKDLTACAEWIWEVLQGDFNDNASTAQVVTGTVISMIPFVDQICDVRDVVANCKKINGEPGNSWHWIAIVLTLIGLFPSLGSLFKGCGKIVFASMRKAGHVSGAAPQIAKFLEISITQLNKFLARPEVVRSLKALKIDNPYKSLSKEIRIISSKLNTKELVAAFDAAKGAAESMLGIVKKWGSAGVARKAEECLRMLDGVRRKADAMIGKALKPVQDILSQIARRLDIEADMAHRAHLNSINPHAFSRLTLSAEEAAFNKAKPGWVDKTGVLTHSQISRPPAVPPGWTSTAVDPKRGRHPLNNAHTTFHTIQPVIIPPGTTLYRIIDPASSDNSICWMSKLEFDKLKSKDDWRRKFAVWANWNSNGEFVTYVVPPGNGLHVWEGVTASQAMKGTDYVLEGGARQIVINPADLEKSLIGKRQSTNWGYSDMGGSTSLVGVPVQKNNWYESK
ncbi:MAG: hypothetical protein V4631_22680 [Pseudomonadota bacterium]